MIDRTFERGGDPRRTEILLGNTLMPCWTVLMVRFTNNIVKYIYLDIS